MNFKDIIESINGKKKQIADLIVESEIISVSTGLPVFDIFDGIASKIQDKQLKTILKNISGKLRRGVNRSQVYSKYFDRELLMFIKQAEEKGISVGEIFKDYRNIKNKVETAKKKISSVLVEPLVMYILISIVSIFSISRLETILRDQKFPEADTLALFKQIVIFLLFFLPIFLIILFIKFGYKLPYLKRAYKELEGYKYLAIINMLYATGFSSIDISEFIKRSYMKKQKFSKKSGIEFLEQFFGQLLEPQEIAIISIGIKTLQLENMIKNILPIKEVNFESIIDSSVGALSKVLILIGVIPISFLAMSLLTLISTLTSKL